MMQLIQVDKTTYRKHLNIIILISILTFASLSLGLAQLTIFLFTDGQGSHFAINLAGVIAAMVILGLGLNAYKQHDFMHEVYYVWRLKQQLNQITRRLRAINRAVANGDVRAIHIMAFYYKACRQLYELDDNTIVMDELAVKAAALDAKIDALQLELADDEINPDWVRQF